MASKKQKGRVWTPGEVDRYVRNVRISLDKLTDARYGYREAHKHVRGDRRDQHVHDENRGLRVSGGDVSDPTHNQVVSQMGNRKRLADASDELDAALTALDSAISKIRSVFSGPDDYYVPLESYRP